LSFKILYRINHHTLQEKLHFATFKMADCDC
jgi:hypothetical protein